LRITLVSANIGAMPTLVYSLKLHVTCPACRAPNAVNELVASVACHACATTIAIGEKTWKALAVDHVTHRLPGMMRGGDVDVDVEKDQVAAPACAGCHAALGELHAGDIRCATCGHGARVAAPGELGALLHVKATWLVTSRADAGSVTRTPLVFACQKCGGSLEVDGSARTVPCTYCSVTNFLPDAIWQVLHPAPVALPIYVVCEFATERDVQWLDVHERERAARNNALDVGDLEQLARDDSATVRKLVAANTHTPPAALLELARHDRDHGVRVAAVHNPHLGQAGLLELIAHGDKESHKAIADLKKISVEVLAAMASSPSHALQLAAIGHAELTDDLVLHLAQQPQHADVQAKAERIVHARKLDKKPGLLSRLFGD
jgi:hypothetical protein